MKFASSLLVAGVFAVVLGTSSAAQAAGTATGYDRPVNIWLLDTMLAHTYEKYVGWYAPGGYTGSYTATFGGDASGGNATQVRSVSNDAAEWSCILGQATNLTYLLTGVCHQGTNRGLYQTPVPWVRNWGTVDGSGVSNSMFDDVGSWFPFGPEQSPGC